MPQLKKFWEEARSRRIPRALAIYLSTSFTLLGAVNLFSGKYNLSPRVFDTLFIFLLCTLPALILNTWRRGSGEAAPVTRGEKAFYAALLIVALSITIRILTAPGLPRIRAEDRSIAVLPFSNLGLSSADEPFCDGVTEDIITQLSKIADLKVISRTSVMSFKKTSKPIRAIGQELGAAFILEGSVRRDADRVRIVGQLIDARADKHLWAETYDRRLTDILAIQSEVAMAIARELRVRLSRAEKERIRRAATGNIEAYAYYLNGREAYYEHSEEGNARAIDLFKKALELDPDYAVACAGLADAYVQKQLRIFDSRLAESWLDMALEMAERAVSLDPGCAEGYKALGLIADSRGRRKEALDDYRKAVELNPGYAAAVANIGGIHFSLGHYDEALVWTRKACDLEPGLARHYAQTALLYYQLGFDDTALVWANRALDFQPAAVFPRVVAAYVAASRGRFEEAGRLSAEILARDPGNPSGLDAAGDAELLAGRFQEAGEYYDRLIKATSIKGIPGNKMAYVLQKIQDSKTASLVLEANVSALLEDPGLDQEGSSIRFYLAEAFALQGRRSEALESLEKAFRAGYADRWFLLDPLFEGLREDERFASASQEYQLKREGMRNKVLALGLADPVQDKDGL